MARTGASDGMGRESIRSRPVTIRDTSNRSSTMRRWVLALRSMISIAYAESCGPRRLPRRSAVQPNTAISGVRNSCESMAKNSSRAWFAFSAASRPWRSAARNLRLAEPRFDPCDELAGRERFDDIVIGARSQALCGRFFAGTRRQQHDWYLCRSVIGPKRSQQSESVQPGHHHIGNHQVRRVPLDAGKGRQSVSVRPAAFQRWSSRRHRYPRMSALSSTTRMFADGSCRRDPRGAVLLKRGSNRATIRAPLRQTHAGPPGMAQSGGER